MFSKYILNHHLGNEGLAYILSIKAQGSCSTPASVAFMLQRKQKLSHIEPCAVPLLLVCPINRGMSERRFCRKKMDSKGGYPKTRNNHAGLRKGSTAQLAKNFLSKNWKGSFLAQPNNSNNTRATPVRKRATCPMQMRGNRRRFISRSICFGVCTLQDRQNKMRFIILLTLAARPPGQTR